VNKDYQSAVTLCGREGNRRSGTALAMRYRLQWSNHLQTRGLRSNGVLRRLLFLPFNVIANKQRMGFYEMLAPRPLTYERISLCVGEFGAFKW